MLNRRLLVVCAAFFATTLQAGSQPSGFTLISDADYARELAAAAAQSDQLEIFIKGADVGAPAIDVRKPKLDQGVKPPVDIEVFFVAQADAMVDIKTLKILYGVLRIDVTKMVLDHAMVTPQGMSAPGAALPKGNHTLTLEIADTLGRKGRQKLKFEVI